MKEEEIERARRRQKTIMEVKGHLNEFLQEGEPLSDIAGILAELVSDYSWEAYRKGGRAYFRSFRTQARRQMMCALDEPPQKDDPANTLYGLRMKPNTYELMQQVLKTGHKEADKVGAKNSYPLYLALTNAVFEVMKENGADLRTQDAIRGYFQDLWKQRQSDNLTI